jgi:hypothetical protein
MAMALEDWSLGQVGGSEKWNRSKLAPCASERDRVTSPAADANAKGKSLQKLEIPANPNRG